MQSYLALTKIQSAIMQSLIGVAACALVISGCAGGTKLTSTAKGGVYLEEVSDFSFEASHPAVIDQATISKIVKGMYRNDRMNESSRMSVGGSKPMRIFSDEDAEFLSPLLAQGLAKAKPEQLVWFRVSSSAGSGSEPTTGSLYVLDGSLYLTIGKGTKPTDFMPETAAHTEPAPAYAADGALDAVTMVIDYHALATAPLSAAMPIKKTTLSAPIAPTVAAIPEKPEVIPASVGQDDFMAQKLNELKIANEALYKKDTEIMMLRKESEWMKRELRNRDEEIQAMRSMKVYARPTPKKNAAQATQSR
ncbi:MAG: hypothetical protein HXY51_10340 [Nitrospirae bacterium]|nr:hypothetical protein [Nitrospirota bacterium]